jgi:hypothetical protein
MDFGGFHGWPLNIGVRRSRGRRVIVGLVGRLISTTLLRSMLTPATLEAFRGRIYEVNQSVYAVPLETPSAHPGNCDTQMSTEGAQDIAEKVGDQCPPAEAVDFAAHFSVRRRMRRLLADAPHTADAIHIGGMDPAREITERKRREGGGGGSDVIDGKSMGLSADEVERGGVAGGTVAEVRGARRRGKDWSFGDVDVLLGSKKGGRNLLGGGGGRPLLGASVELHDCG